MRISIHLEYNGHLYMQVINTTMYFVVKVLKALGKAVLRSHVHHVEYLVCLCYRKICTLTYDFQNCIPFKWKEYLKNLWILTTVS